MLEKLGMHQDADTVFNSLGSGADFFALLVSDRLASQGKSPDMSFRAPENYDCAICPMANRKTRFWIVRLQATC